MKRLVTVAFASLLGLCAAPDAMAQRSALPLNFIAEQVILQIEPDSVRVDAVYVFICHADAATAQAGLVYPYPQDPLLGGARTVSLECRLGAQAWRELAHHELPGGHGARWSLPLAAGDTLQVRTTYRQALRTTYARYIVTSTAAWGQPLQFARFEVHLPPGAVPEEFSFPLEPCGQDELSHWCYEAEDFLPVQDFIVRWRQ